MLRSLKDLERYTVSAKDDDIGNVVNFLLDDEHWIGGEQARLAAAQEGLLSLL